MKILLVLNDAPYGIERTYNAELMLASPLLRGAAVGVCGTCMDARGIRDADLVSGSHRSTLEELADWMVGADKVIVF
jgi:uncharacterized protein involved in oxidation of intracellular sulfur